MKFIATSGNRVETVDVTEEGKNYRVQVGERVWEIDARPTSPGIYSLLVDGVSYVAAVTEHDGACVVDVAGETHTVRVEDHTRYVIRTRGGADGGRTGQTLAAPLPGRVTHVAVQAGDQVQAGDTLLVIEAMKMENEFRASAAGTVAEVRVEPGQAVNAGDVLIVIAS